MISDVPAAIPFPPMPDWEVCDWGHNRISRLPEGLGNLVNLFVFSIDFNRITTIDEAMLLPKLRNLKADGNRIRQIPSRIGNVTDLTVIKLSRNQITSVPSSMRFLTRIGKLFLQDNNITALPNDLFTYELGMASLNEIDLSGNTIRRLPPGLDRLQALRRLDAHDNKLTSIPTEIGKLNLRVLVLYNNLIREILGEVLTSSLRVVLLHDNNIKAIPSSLQQLVLARGRSLSLTLHGNPSTCAVSFASPDNGRPLVSCDCAPGFAGERDCTELREVAQQRQVFASTRGIIRVLWPSAVSPRVAVSPPSVHIDEVFPDQDDSSLSRIGCRPTQSSQALAAVSFGMVAGEEDVALLATLKLTMKADGSPCRLDQDPDMDVAFPVLLPGFRFTSTTEKLDGIEVEVFRRHMDAEGDTRPATSPQPGTTPIISPTTATSASLPKFIYFCRNFLAEQPYLATSCELSSPDTACDIPALMQVRCCRSDLALCRDAKAVPASKCEKHAAPLPCTAVSPSTTTTLASTSTASVAVTQADVVLEHPARGLYVRQPGLHDGRPWYQQVGTDTALFFFNSGDPQFASWRVGTSRLSESSVGEFRQGANYLTPMEIHRNTTWQFFNTTSSQLETLNLAMSVRQVALEEHQPTVDRSTALQVLLVVSAFQHADSFPSSSVPVLTGEPGQAHRYPISKSALSLPHEVQGNRHISTQITYHLRPRKRWLIDVGSMRMGGNKTSESDPSGGLAGIDATKEVQLPRNGLVVSPTPVNFQLPEWNEQRFSVTVLGRTLVVTRADAPGSGWSQELQLMATTPEHHICSSALRVESTAVEEGDRRSGPHELVLEADGAIQPESCALELVATDASTGEALHVTDVRLNVTDCYSRCGDKGHCFDGSGSAFDGVSSCECDIGYTGDLCEREHFVVNWPEKAALAATLDDPVIFSPGAFEGRKGPAVLRRSDVRYEVGGLPCGLTFDTGSGQVVGRPREAGLFDVNVFVRWRQDNISVALVNGKPLPLRVSECDSSASCNGGRCVGANGTNCHLGDCPTAGGPYDGEFFCDCSGVQGFSGPRCDERELVLLRVTWLDHPVAWPAAIVGKTYMGSEAQPRRLSVTPADVAHDGSLTYLGSGLPCGMSVNEKSGALEGIPGVPGAYTSIAIIASAANQTAVVNQGYFSLEVIDCDDDLSCNGGLCVDHVPYDTEFRCNCSGTGMEGSFCAEPLSQASTSVGTIAGVTTAVALVLLAIVVAMVVVWRARNHSSEGPFDFQEVLASMKSDGLIDERKELGVPRELLRPSVQLLDEIGAGQVSTECCRSVQSLHNMAPLPRLSTPTLDPHTTPVFAVPHNTTTHGCSLAQFSRRRSTRAPGSTPTSRRTLWR